MNYDSNVFFTHVTRRLARRNIILNKHKTKTSREDGKQQMSMTRSTVAQHENTEHEIM